MAALDLSRPVFWLFLGLAILLLTPQVTGRGRRITLCLLNLGFIAAVLGSACALGAVSYGAAVHGFGWIGCTSRMTKPWQRIARGTGWVALLLMFLVHKGPGTLTAGWALQPMKTFMVGIGFSFVLLRTLDRLRWPSRAPARPPTLLDTLNYLFPFHMLAAGPIQSWNDFSSQPQAPPVLDRGRVLQGLHRLANGLFMKFVLADLLQHSFLTGFRSPFPYQFFEMQVFYLWLLLDFAGYSSLAVGAGILMGVATPENFNAPLLARNILEFWERWHLTLTACIRKHLFYPVQMTLLRRTGGRRVAQVTTVSLLLAFLACGLWHRFSVPFLAWGLVHAGGVLVFVAYRGWLQKRLGQERMNAYRANRWVRAVAMLLTYEFVATSLLLIARPRCLPWP
jgi:D-alanyl-lipoteichoic acid acyltransferase DltB (MBOAT superfamily)